MRRTALLGVLAALVLVAPASALINDGDFEGAGAGPWTTGTAPWGSNQALDFDAAGPTGQALRLYFSGSNGSGAGSFAAIQSFAVPAGVNSIDIDLDWQTIRGTGNGWYEILLQAGGANYDAPAAGDLLLKEEYGFGGGTPPHGNWQHVSFPGLAVTPGGNYQIALKMGGNPGNGNEAWFDNVRITPEPASLGLFAIAGLVMFRRRRA